MQIEDEPTFSIRPVDLADEAEVNTIASLSMLTILETLPEARRDPTVVPNFSISAMATMYRGDLGRADRRFWVAVDEDGQIVGHAIALLRTDDSGLLHGYSYTRYVLPGWRRKGIARALLQEAKRWWWAQGVVYVLAHTHATNHALQQLFLSEGFVIGGQQEERWSSVVLRWSPSEA